MCIHCHTFVKPDVFKDDYVTKVVRVLDRLDGSALKGQAAPILSLDWSAQDRQVPCLPEGYLPPKAHKVG